MLMTGECPIEIEFYRMILGKNIRLQRRVQHFQFELNFRIFDKLSVGCHVSEKSYRENMNAEWRV